MEPATVDTESRAVNGTGGPLPGAVASRPPLSTKARVPFQPGRTDAEGEDPDAPLYYLRVWDVLREREYRRETRIAAPYISPGDLARALRRAAKEHIGDDDLPPTLALLERWEKTPKVDNTDWPLLPDLPAPVKVADDDEAPKKRRAKAKAAAAPAESPEAAAVREKRQALIELWGEVEGVKTLMRVRSRSYRELLAASEEWWEATLYLALKYALVDFERVTDVNGNDVTFEKRHGFPTDATLSAIAADHRQAIALKALALQRPTETQRKN